MEQHRNHVHIAMKLGGLVQKLLGWFRNGGIVSDARSLPMRVMDTGGKIRYGEAALNLSRTPEVLTPGEDMREVIEVLAEIRDLLRWLRRDTQDVAPGVGREMRGASGGMLQAARTR